MIGALLVSDEEQDVGHIVIIADYCRTECRYLGDRRISSFPSPQDWDSESCNDRSAEERCDCGTGRPRD